MLAVSPQVSPPPSRRSYQSMSDLPSRRLFVDDDDEADGFEALPSVLELLEEVGQLQLVVQNLGPRDRADDGARDGSASSMRSRMTSAYSNGARPQLYHRQSSFSSDLNTSFSSDSGAPPRPSVGRVHSSTSVAPRVAALTKENISLLRAPLDRRGNFAGGSVCGSQKSRTSVRTDGGAVFSRLYQPDFYKTRDMKLKTIRDRQENLNFSFLPKTNHRSSVCSRDSSDAGSMYSAKTDVMNVSSRLYDPDYMRKRTAKLQKMREERELRSCTFAPTTNPANAAANAIRRTPSAPTPSRK